MALNERDLFLAMIGRARQLWAEHLVGLELSQDEKRAWDNYRWLHEQTQLYFTHKFDGGLDATPTKLNEPFTREYRRRILHTLDNGKEVVGARVPLGDGVLCIPLMRAKDDQLDIFCLRSVPLPSGQPVAWLCQLAGHRDRATGPAPVSGNSASGSTQNGDGTGGSVNVKRVMRGRYLEVR
jgi:hypothetical protein